MAYSVSEHLEDEPDAVRVTRQDILHNRLEQCECAAIELRLEVNFCYALWC